MTEAYREFEAQSLFCPRCRRAGPVRKKLLLVLPTGDKYDYVCAACGTQVGAKIDRDPAGFRETARAAMAPPRPDARRGRPPGLRRPPFGR
jgi:hypothetical protein